jgi:hypothetical protein
VSVSGNDNPLRTNSELVEVAEVIVVLASLTLRVAFRVLLEPTTTLPKLKLVGDAASWPAVVPVPDSTIPRLAAGGLKPTEILPVFVPATFGANTTLKV